MPLLVNVCLARAGRKVEARNRVPDVLKAIVFMVAKIDRLADIKGQYDVVLCDVWGVLHNGVESFQPAAEALRNFRIEGGTVVLITNSPRLSADVGLQIVGLGVGADSYDAIVTSGDVTRALIEDGPKNIHFVGADWNQSLLDGLDVSCVGIEEADAVVCAGLRDDENEQAEDYLPMLEQAKARDLPFVCANPDIVVERGHKLVPCAGAIAALYEKMGGVTRISGKPHRPIYEAALETAKTVKGAVDPRRVVAIGDGMPTDIKGAHDFGLDVIYIALGIHAAIYSRTGVIDEAALDTFLAEHRMTPVGWMPRLR
ncbi:MAG: haloacid dehalogenase [Rhizobiaceae bacterium MnEN-MB40S]|nr:MAG: haloacid dehalogenase [Rhizobiaceae bacterium MnEN-MB40S]